MKRLAVLLIAATFMVTGVFADEPEAYNPIDAQEGPAEFQFIIGPRIGVSYVATSASAFTDAVNDYFYTSDPVGYVPVTSIFGLIAEQRILLGETNSHFAFQEILLVSGLEQAIALPSGAFLIGFRAASGFEIGVGPTASFSGIGVVAAIGWTFSFSGVYVPVDLSVVLPNRERPMSIAVTTGFNFITRSRRRY